MPYFGWAWPGKVGVCRIREISEKSGKKDFWEKFVTKSGNFRDISGNVFSHIAMIKSKKIFLLARKRLYLWQSDTSEKLFSETGRDDKVWLFFTSNHKFGNTFLLKTSRDDIINMFWFY